MASSTDAAHYFRHWEFASGIVFVVGLTVQSFIVASNAVDWLKRGPVTAADQIIATLGAARFTFHSLSYWHVLQRTFFNAEPVMLLNVVVTIREIIISSSIWFSALLSIIFCLKISNFHNVLLLRLMVMISQKTTRLIVLSVLWSATYTAVYVLLHLNEFPYNSTFVGNIFEDVDNSEVLLAFIILWYIVPLFIYFLSTVFLLTPLCLQMRKMKSDENLTCRVDAYIKAIVFSIVSFVTCAGYTTFSIAIELDINLGTAEVFFIWNMFPLLHSAYMIYATAKLRNHFWTILRRGTRCFVSGKGSESQSRDPVQRITQ